MFDFSLEKWDMKYADDVAEFADNPKIAANLRNAFVNPYTKKDAEEYIRMCSENDEKSQSTRAIVVDGRAVGSIGFFMQSDVYCKNAEIGYWLAEPYWRKGIMSQALTQLCKFGFDNYDIERFFAEPYSYNTGSKRVLEKAGFKLEGIMKKGVYKNGIFYDYCMYALLREEFTL